jgi:restriction endonuclease S subunit
MGLTLAEVFSTNLSKVSQKEHFRSGALYRSVWDVYNGELFSGTKFAYPKVKLRKLIQVYSAKTLKKGLLDEEYVLIDLNDIESRRGRMKEGKKRKVTSINSDKVVFGDADLLFSKLRPYLGYVIINDKSIPFIGTTELVPFKVREAIAEYVKYLLLTKEFLHLSTLLMYGKEHPRLDVEDLLDVKVPCPPIEKQKEIVALINENIEKKVDSYKAKIFPLQSVIKRVFQQEQITKETAEQVLTVYQSSFVGIGQQKYVRCGSRYRFFWDVRKGKLFTNSGYDADKLGNLVDFYDAKVLNKGLLKSEHILIDLPDIIPMEGRIRNKVRTVNEIGSDKVVFGKADLLYSHIDPFLGHVILNDKKKPYIGTTELIPLHAKEDTDPRYIRYLLLSRNFLDASRYLMYGKRHPRIHVIDMMNLKVPRPKMEVQKKISDEIEEVEKQNIALNNEIDCLYEKIEKILLSQLT